MTTGTKNNQFKNSFKSFSSFFSREKEPSVPFNQYLKKEAFEESITKFKSLFKKKGNESEQVITESTLSPDTTVQSVSRSLLASDPLGSINETVSTDGSNNIKTTSTSKFCKYNSLFNRKTKTTSKLQQLPLPPREEFEVIFELDYCDDKLSISNNRRFNIEPDQEFEWDLSESDVTDKKEIFDKSDFLDIDINLNGDIFSQIKYIFNKIRNFIKGKVCRLKFFIKKNSKITKFLIFNKKLKKNIWDYFYYIFGYGQENMHSKPFTQNQEPSVPIMIWQC